MSRRTLLLALLASATLAACGDKVPVTATEAERLPVDRVSSVLALQPGVVAGPSSAGYMAQRSDGSFSYVDGVPVQGANRGNAFNGSGPRNTPTDTASFPTMLIRTGYASVRVDSLEPAIAALEALARGAGGYVGNTSFTGGEERSRSATLQLRVPSARFGTIQAGLDQLGEVLALTVNVQDVGEEYTDAAARLTSKRQVETRLLDLLRTRTGKLSDVVELERALQQVREEIESTEGRLRYLRNQVGLSTMTVTLSEPGLVIAEPGYHPIRDAFGVAWRNFTGFIAGLIAAAGWLLPLALLLAAVARGTVWVWRRRKQN